MRVILQMFNEFVGSPFEHKTYPDVVKKFEYTKISVYIFTNYEGIREYRPQRYNDLTRFPSKWKCITPLEPVPKKFRSLYLFGNSGELLDILSENGILIAEQIAIYKLVNIEAQGVVEE